ncbi:hypothetical protein L3X38_002576 [Prunus dulcis]|uniref:Ubiquitin-like protease family profile domain-containing protein n=1 Tax=Prunus dulcis TaxID=3755 RepID=A0AAD4ZK50_PRUDU|nr:hypothetical protein L3X38_002576 [Prunus dulcis]
MFSDQTIFEIKWDLPTTQPIEEKEEEKKEKKEEHKKEEKEEDNKKQEEEKEKEKKLDAPTPDVPTRIQMLKNRERKRRQASCYDDNFWEGLCNEKVTNCDIKDIVWYLELSQNVIEVYIQIEKEKIGPMQTDTPQYMSTCTWTYMQNYIEPAWHRVMYEPLLDKLGKCNVLFFPIISSSEFHYILLAFHKLEQKWRHYNPLRSLGSRKEERSIDIAHQIVNVVEGWLEYVKPKAQAFLKSRTMPKLVKKRDEPPTPVAKEMSTNEELTFNWILQSPCQFTFEDATEYAQQSSSL